MDTPDQEKDLRRTHTREAIAARLQASANHSYLGDFVLGAVDGAVTTFALVAGAAGASLSSGVAIVLGLANVLADGFSMAASNFLRARADQQLVERFRQIEEMHIDRIPEGEREEIRQIFAQKGFQGETLESIVQTITRDRRQWVNTMLTEELGLQISRPHPWRSGLSTFIAFLIAGLVPLVPLFTDVRQPAREAFPLAAAFTAFTFFVIGYVRGKILEHRPWRTGIETMLLGGAAAALAYIVGAWLHEFASA